MVVISTHMMISVLDIVFKFYVVVRVDSSSLTDRLGLYTHISCVCLSDTTHWTWNASVTAVVCFAFTSPEYVNCCLDTQSLEVQFSYLIRYSVVRCQLLIEGLGTSLEI